MSVASTSLERTYRYLRLSLVGVVVMIGVSIAAVMPEIGSLGSISAAYYTPAGPIFVGGVFAVGLAMLALSGHSFGQISLDLAAIMAPVIAIVPAPVFASDVQGLIVDCGGAPRPCVPIAFHAAVDNGMLALIVTGAVGWVAALVVAAVQRTFSRRSLWALAVAGALIGATAAWWLFAPDSFLRAGHAVAAASFFAFTALTALASAFDAGRSGSTGYAVGYGIIAFGILAVLVLLLGIVIVSTAGVRVPEPYGLSPVFLGEAIALGLFAAFWFVQTIETWHDPDPAIRVRA